MLPFGIGIPEVLMILVVVPLVVGPSKLPELARTLAKGIRAARRAGEEIRNAIDIDDLDRPPRRSWENSQRVEEVQAYPSEEFECESGDDEMHGAGPISRGPATASSEFYGISDHHLNSESAEEQPAVEFTDGSAEVVGQTSEASDKVT